VYEDWNQAEHTSRKETCSSRLQSLAEIPPITKTLIQFDQLNFLSASQWNLIRSSRIEIVYRTVNVSRWADQSEQAGRERENRAARLLTDNNEGIARANTALRALKRHFTPSKNARGGFERRAKSPRK
jgi:hypothetical protein